jgi:hypothetical protein
MQPKVIIFYVDIASHKWYIVLVCSDCKQCCQIFLGTTYQNGEKYTKLSQNIPNGHKVFPMAVK